MKVKKISKHITFAPITIEILEKIMEYKGLSYSGCINYLVQDFCELPEQQETEKND